MALMTTVSLFFSLSLSLSLSHLFLFPHRPILAYGKEASVVSYRDPLQLGLKTYRSNGPEGSPPNLKDVQATGYCPFSLSHREQIEIT